MSKEAMLITIGLLVALTQFTGFPGLYKDYFYIIAGVAVAVIAFVTRQERIWKARDESPQHKEDTFIEGGVRSSGARV